MRRAAIALPLWVSATLIHVAIANPMPTPFAAAEKEFATSAPLCGGSVAGQPDAQGRPGAHITWRTHGVAQDRDAVVTRLRTLFAAEPDPAANGCTTWRLGARGDSTVSVCATDAKGPWLQCGAVSDPAVRSLITFSQAARPAD